MIDKKLMTGDILIDDRPSDYSHTPVFSSPEEKDAYLESEKRRIQENAARKNK